MGSDRTIAQWFEEGVRCFKKPDGVGAIKAFEKVIDHDPAYRHNDGNNPYFYLGKISEIESRLSDAICYYSRALSVDPWDEESLIGRGSCHTVRGNPQQAVDDFKRVLQIDPAHRRVAVANIYYAIGENYRKSGDWPRAHKWATKAVQAEPLNTRHLALLAEAKAKL